MRESVAVLSLLLGIAFPLLLNGQPFSNNLLGIGFALGAVSLILGRSLGRGVPKPDLRAGDKVVIGLAVVLVVFLAVQLPSAYRFQADFNRKVKELRKARANGVRPGAFRPTRAATSPDRSAFARSLPGSWAGLSAQPGPDRIGS